MANRYTKLIVALIITLMSFTEVKAQYCTTYLYVYGCYYDDYVNSVSTTGGSTNINNPNSGCASSWAGYSNYSNIFGTLTVAQNASFNLTMINNPWYPEWYKVFIDFNSDGDFADAGENVYTSSAAVATSATVGGAAIPISIPFAATVGATRMRIRCSYYAMVDACSYEQFGEVEDYNVTIVAGCATSVTSQPSNVSGICAPNPTSFSITAANAISYQWQLSTNGGSTWANVANGGVYSGVTTASLGISATSVPMNSYQYRSIAIGATCSAVSNAATLSIGTPGVVSSTPGSACSGTSGAVSVVPTPGGSVSWYDAAVGGTLLGTGNTLTIPSVTVAATYYADVTAPPISGTLTNTAGTSNSQTGAMQDIKPLVNMTLTGFDWIPASTSTYDVQIYYRVGTYVGNNMSSSGWILLGTQTGVATTASVPVTMNFSSPPALTANQVYGFYVSRTVSGGSVRYWNGTTSVGQLWVSNADLETYTGIGQSALFSGSVFTPRTLGGTYRYSVGSSCAPLGRTGVAMTLNTLPSISSNPGNITICSGQSTNFAVAATGTGVVYQWQESTNGGVTYNNVTNGGVYGGATTANLSISNAPATMNGYRYRCYVPGTCSPAQTSTAGILTVNASPAVTLQPSNTIACPLGNASFSVAGSGLGLGYQWQENNGGGWVNLTNAGVYSTVTTSTLNITGATLGMTGYQYKCIITGSCLPSVQSNVATLSINATIPITQQPQSSQICVGTNTSFAVGAVGSGILYQWQESQNAGVTWNNLSNGGVYNNTTTATITLTGASLSYSGYVYRCVVSNACVAPFTTNNATLTVDASPAITLQPVSTQTVCAGTNITLSVAASGGGLLYQWQASATGTAGPYANIASFGTYSGYYSNTLIIQGSPSSLNGYAYRCVVSGNCAPAVISTACVLTVNGVPTVVTQPVQPTICVGSNASFTVVATGTALVYQWQESTTTGYVNVTNGGMFSGATTATLTLTAPLASMTGNTYRCEISGSCLPAVTTIPRSLVVNTPPTITGQPLDKAVCVGGTTSFAVYATAQTTSPVTYQWQYNDGISGFQNVLNSAPYSGATSNILTITNANVVMNGYIYRCIITSDCAPFATSSQVKLQVWTLPAVVSHPTDLTLCPQSIASFTVVGTGSSLTYRWQVNTGSGYVNVIDNGTYSGASSSTLLVQTAATQNNYLFRCVLTGVCAPPATTNAARLNVLNPVIIQMHTLTDTICEGGSLKIGVSATGQSLKYQWQRKTSTIGSYVDLTDIPPYSGVNTDSLRFTAAPDSIAGFIYRCRVYETQQCNLSFYTADIPLGMFFAPATNPASLKIGPLKTATFAVATGGGNFQWQVNKNNGGGFVDLTNSGPYSGVNSNTLVISPTQLSMSEYKFRCVVDGICRTPVPSKQGVLIIDPSLSVSTVAGRTAGITVYPNPLEGTKLNISVTESLKGNTEVKVTDKLGKVVYTGKLDFDGHKVNSIELNALAAGVYTLQIINQSESIIESVRFTKQ